MSRTTNRLCLETLETREVPADLAYALSLVGLPANSITQVAATGAGEVYVAGTFSSTVDLDPSTTDAYRVTPKGGSDVFVAKYSFDGDLIWAETLDGLADESSKRIAFDGMGNVYVAGTFSGAVDFDPSPNASAVYTAASGGSAFVWKLNQNGNFVSAWTVDGTSAVSGMAVDPAGNVVVGGTFQGTADFNPDPNVTSKLIAATGSSAAFVWKLSQAGAFTWADAIQTTGTLVPAAVALDGNGFAYLSGTFTGTADFNPSDSAKAQVAAGSTVTPFVVKLANDGSYLWSDTVRTITPVADKTNTVNGLAVDGIGNVYLTGTFAGVLDFDPGNATTSLTSADESMDGFVWKLDPAGALLYARRFGGSKDETVSDLSIHPAGDVYVTGTFTGIADFDPSSSVANLGSGAGTVDGYVLKLGPTGALVYTRSLGGGASTVRPTGIFADAGGNMFVTGAFSGKADFEPANAIHAVGGGNGSGFVAKLSPAVNAARAPKNLPPTSVSAGGPYLFLEGKGLSVKGAATDPEGQPLTYSWDLNGDGVFGDAFGKRVVLNQLQMGALALGDGTSLPRTIKVRVLDGVNLAVETSATMTIQSVAPTIRLNAPTSAVEGVRPTMSFKVLSDPSSRDVKAGMKASWDFNDDGEWDLGDGTSYAGSVAGAVKIPAEFVADSGPLAVRVRVYDKDGAYTEKTTTIVIGEKAPTAKLVLASPASAGNPTTFQFTNPVDGPADTQAGFTYSFDLDGDGTYETTGSTPQASVVFPIVGTYVVKGKITDQDGAFTEYALAVNVTL